jgi:hypothetical protein
VESLGESADTTADYTRLAALPILQSPSPVTDRSRWLGASAATVGPLVWRYPDEAGNNPVSPWNFNVRGLPIDSTTEIVLPTDTPDRDLGGTRTGGLPLQISPARWDEVTIHDLVMEPGESPAEFEVRTSGRLRWDSRSLMESPLSVPFHPDAAIVAAFGGPPDTSGLLASDLPGSLAETPPPVPHLLATSVEDGGGELDPSLLRAPAPGVVRFERFHHVVHAAGSGMLTLRRPSREGRLVIVTIPPESVQPSALVDAFDDVAAIDRRLFFTFEDVDAESVLEILPAIVIDQVRRFGELLDAPACLTNDDPGRFLRETLVWLLRTWQAAAELEGLLALVPTSIADTLRGLVPPGWMPAGRGGDAVLRAALTLVVAHGDALSALKDFVSEIFAPLLLGDALADVGIAIDPEDAAPGTPAKELVDFAGLSLRWLPCFAGCPLGRPGSVWVPDEIRPLVWDEENERFKVDGGLLHRVVYSTFQVEAFYQARLGGEGDPIADPAEARADGAITEAALRDWWQALPGSTLGSKTVLRLLELDLPARSFTTLDWLGELTHGTARRRAQLPLLDFEPDATAGHPLAELVDWDGYVRARGVRDGTDQLDASRVHDRTLSWWVAHTRLADAAGKWPSMWSAVRIPASPRTPYRPAGRSTSGRDRTVTDGPWQYVLSEAPAVPETKSSVARCGWDDFDFMAVAQAAAAVRDGRTFQGPVHPALLLAVAETEGYRLFAPQSRVRDVPPDRGRREDGASFVWGPPPDQAQMMLGQGESVALYYARDLAIANWWLHPHELDVMVYSRADKPQTVANEGAWVVNRLLRPDWGGKPGDAPPTDPIDPNRTFIDPEFLPGDAYEFSRRRVVGEWIKLNGADVVRTFRLTRALQPLGLAVQAAIFQWVHRQLSEMTGYLGESYTRVDELADPGIPPPSPGVDALDPARADYIAYWATVYLAFNASPGVWNKWVNLAQARRRGTERATHYLVYRLDNSTSTPPNAPVYGALSNMMRFAVALDAYLRIEFETGAVDTSDPGGRRWP